MLVYEFPISTVERFERRVSSRLIHWLGLSRSLGSITLYGNESKLISSLTEEFMATTAREVLQYRESKDEKVSQAGIEVRTGRKWRANGDWQKVEGKGGNGPDRVTAVPLVGAVATGRSELGTIPTTHYNKLKGKERWDQVHLEVRAGI